MDTVELRPAFEWTCEECGQDHWERAISVDPQSDLAAKSRKWYQRLALNIAGLNPMAGLLLSPEFVACRSCGTTFKTQW